MRPTTGILAGMSGSSRGLTECYANESWKDESLDVQRCKKRLRADSRRTDSRNWPVTWLQQFLKVWPKAGASIFSSSRGQSAKIENSQPQKMWMVTSPRLGCIAGQEPVWYIEVLEINPSNGAVTNEPMKQSQASWQRLAVSRKHSPHAPNHPGLWHLWEHGPSTTSTLSTMSLHSKPHSY